MADSGGSGFEVTRTYDWSEVSPSVAIIETIAAYEGNALDWTVENQDLPLHQYMDADALDALIGGDTDLALSFSFSAYQIQIAGNEVAVAPDGPSPT